MFPYFQHVQRNAEGMEGQNDRQTDEWSEKRKRRREGGRVGGWAAQQKGGRKED